MAGQISDTRTIRQTWVHARSAIEKGIQDEWTVGTNFLAFCNNEKYAKGKVKRLMAGGPDIRFGVEFEAGSAQSFYGFDAVPLEARDPFTQGKQSWRAIAVPIGLSLTDILETNGERNAVGTLISNQTQNGLNTMRSELSSQLVGGNVSAATLGAGKDIDGLQFALQYQNDQNDGYAEWDRSADTWARHEVQDVGSSFTVGTGVVTADNLTKYLDYYIRKVQRGKGAMGKPTAILHDFDALDYLYQRARWGGITHILIEKELVDLGYTVPTYNGIPLIEEPAIADNLPGVLGTEADHAMYLVNTRFMRLHVNKAADMKMSDLKEIAGQFAFRADIIWVGNLSIVNPRFFATLYGIVAPTIA